MIKVFRNGREVPMQALTFNGGEEHVRLDTTTMYNADAVAIKAQIQSSKDVMQLLMVTDAVRRIGRIERITLHLLYIPYARQDRVCNEGEALSLKVFCDLVNAQKYDKVIVMSPHSDVAMALLDNVVDYTHYFEAAAAQHVKMIDSFMTIVAPDAGAAKRAQKFATYFSNVPVIQANKVRDTATGKIISTEVNGYVADTTCVIYDDLCDRGGTFIPLAKELKNKGAKQVILVVGHGIFDLENGPSNLFEVVDKIITSNSVDFGNRPNSSDFITIHM